MKLKVTHTIKRKFIVLHSWELDLGPQQCHRDIQALCQFLSLCPLLLLPPSRVWLCFSVLSSEAKMSTSSFRIKSSAEGVSFFLRVPPKVPGDSERPVLEVGHTHPHHGAVSGEERVPEGKARAAARRRGQTQAGGAPAQCAAQ